jgi:broad specificity polyphosphatase/5'/3'-nucleotidase SurE
MKALIWETPRMAFSLDPRENQLGILDYTAASGIARHVVEISLSRRFVPGMLLNVNISYLCADEIKGTRITPTRDYVFTVTGWTSA